MWVDMVYTFAAKTKTCCSLVPLPTVAQCYALCFYQYAHLHPLTADSPRMGMHESGVGYSSLITLATYKYSYIVYMSWCVCVQVITKSISCMSCFFACVY